MPSASAIRIPPDDGGGLVSTSRPRKVTRAGSRSTTSVRGEVLLREQAAALEHPLAHGRGHVALVEEARALRAEALEQVAQLGQPDRVPGLRAAGRPGA